MAGTGTLRGLVLEQQRLIEEQRVEIQRQRSQIEVQFQRTAAMQVQLDRIQSTLQQAAINTSPTKHGPSNGNRDRSNGLADFGAMLRRAPQATGT